MRYMGSGCSGAHQHTRSNNQTDSFVVALCSLCEKSRERLLKGREWLTNWQRAYGVSGGEYGDVFFVVPLPFLC